MTDAPTTALDDLGIGDVAARAGVTANAVRHYEHYGVVSGVRTPGNARRFGIDAVCRIKLARAAQRVGLTLSESAEILATVPPMCPDPDRWAATSRTLVETARLRIQDLEAAAEEFATTAFLRS